MTDTVLMNYYWTLLITGVFTRVITPPGLLITGGITRVITSPGLLITGGITPSCFIRAGP